MIGEGHAYGRNQLVENRVSTCEDGQLHDFEKWIAKNMSV